MIHVGRCWPPLFAFALITVSCAGKTNEREVERETGLTARVLDSLTRVGNAHEPDSIEARFYVARGEYQSFQVVVSVRPETGSRLKIELSDLASSNSKISASQFKVYEERFVEILHGSPDFGGSNRPLGPGLYPDGLVPLSQIQWGTQTGWQVAARKQAPVGGQIVFWFDLYIPPEAVPGEYRCSLKISRDAECVDLPISVRVWHHVLPLKPTLKTSFGIRRDHLNNKRIAELLLEHKLMPFLVDAAELPRDQKLGMNTTGLPLFGDANVRTCTMNPAPSVARIEAARAAYTAIDTYIYPADEIDPCPKMFPSLKEWARNAHKAGTDVLTTVSPQPALMDDGSGTGRSAVDRWVLLPKMFSPAAQYIRQVEQKGDEVWSYNCLEQDNYSPKWQIDFEPINYRIQPGFLSAALGLSGLLYWQVDNWNSDPWSDPVSLRESGYNFPGEGLLVYPSKESGAEAADDDVFPSMRLKWLREGVDDYEYFAMLRAAGRGAWALGVIREVASDWKSWSRNPARLEEVRRTLGQELDKMSAAGTIAERGTPLHPGAQRSQLVN